MELYLDSLNDLNSQLKQLVDIIEDWKGSRTEIRSVPVHLHRLWDQVCHLKNFIDNQLQQNAIFDGNGFDLAGLIRIRQGQSAISSLIEAAQGSALESWLLAPSLSIIERLEKYSKDLRDCTASVEEVCRELIQPDTGDELNQNLPYGITAVTLESTSSIAEQESHQQWMTAMTPTVVCSAVSSSQISQHSSPRSNKFISRKLPKARCHSQCKCQCHKADDLKLEDGKGGACRFRCSSPNCQTKRSRTTKIFVRDATILKREFVISMMTRGFRISCNIKTRPIVPASAEAIKCSMNGDSETFLKLLIAKKASIYDTEPDGWSLLHNSVNNAHVKFVKLLLEFGADKEVTEVGFRLDADTYNCSSIYCPDAYNRKPAHFAKLRVLNPRATEEEKMIFQLVTGEDDDFKLEFGLSPVLSATLGEYDWYDDERPSLEEILNHSRMMADLDVSVDWSSLERKYVGRSPLYLEVVRHYKQGDKKGKTRQESFQDLIEKSDDVQGWSPLLWAAYTGRRKEVEELLDYGADPLKTAQVKRNVYHYAAESANPEALELLLHRGYHKTSGALSAHDIWGETPLHIASSRSAESVKLLLDHGAQIGSIQNTGELPLHYISHLYGEARLSTLQNLLNHLEPKSQLLNSVNSNGQPCLFYCLDTPECVKLLLQWGADVTVVDRKGRNVLHQACFKNRSESLSYLLRHCPVEMVTAVDAEGDTPIFVGFQNKAVDCVLMLLRRHYHPPDIIDRKGWTLLHHAAELNDQSILNYVVSIPGLDRNAKTRDGRTAHDIAHEKNCFLVTEESMERDL